jgi:hypothetical protein
MKSFLTWAGSVAMILGCMPADAAVLSDKLAAVYTDDAPSNIFTLSNACGCDPTWSSAAIDTFTLGTKSHLTGIDAALIAINQNDDTGLYGPDSDGVPSHFGGFDKTSGYQINIYSSAAAAAANLTGDIFSVTIAATAASFGAPLTIDDPNGYILPASPGSTLASFAIDTTLDAGSYWLSVISLNDPDNDGQESIFVGLGGTGDAALANPGGSWVAAFGASDNPIMLGSSAGYRVLGSAVPEPATWAMMIVGFGAAGTIMRRRRITLAIA